ncbi:hypothetical protein [Methylobacterium trifolii]|uniref:Uncharacterized protein n=1 Tax=Methylobacterium trifolii TaxID=1003092 RepID=A0ABQ4TXA1_9HYPH|nr:hypothetical protein [Methylobacterium trifolii]GJE59134.1 hypothetical protein MPOCJGCO_1221 [Methylobacterium trifolii]
MPYPTAILFTLALFTAGMVALGWSQDATAPGFGEWLVAKITEGGLWTGLMLFLVAAGFLGWRQNRTGKDGPPES